MLYMQAEETVCRRFMCEIFGPFPPPSIRSPHHHRRKILSNNEQQNESARHSRVTGLHIVKTVRERGIIIVVHNKHVVHIWYDNILR